jgi:hypothetical protein
MANGKQNFKLRQRLNSLPLTMQKRNRNYKK